MQSLLTNYSLLVAKVDEFCRRTTNEFAVHIACKPGCDDCCRHLTLFPVEAVMLALALRELPEPRASLLKRKASEAPSDRHCPLLIGGLCAMYDARPLICRTHGLPLAIRGEDAHRVDYCPRNFQALDTIPGSAVLRLDRLNEALVMVDAQFRAAVSKTDIHHTGRISIAEALLMNLDNLSDSILHRPINSDPTRQR